MNGERSFIRSFVRSSAEWYEQCVVIVGGREQRHAVSPSIQNRTVEGQRPIDRRLLRFIVRRTSFWQARKVI